MMSTSVGPSRPLDSKMETNDEISVVDEDIQVRGLQTIDAANPTDNSTTDSPTTTSEPLGEEVVVPQPETVLQLPVYDISPSPTPPKEISSKSIPSGEQNGNDVPQTKTIDEETVATQDSRKSIDTTPSLHQEELLCGVCNYPAVVTKKKSSRSTLCCNHCSRPVHFACSKLPPYMIYSLVSTAKKYACEQCVGTPQDFLKNMIADDLINITTTPATTTKEPICTEPLEQRCLELCDTLTKYDIPKVADTMQTIYADMFTINKQLKDTAATVTKAVAAMKRSDAIKPSSPSPSEEQLRKEIDMRDRQISALTSAETLLRDEIDGKASENTELLKDRVKLIESHNNLNMKNQQLSQRLIDYENTVQANEQYRSTVADLTAEIRRLNEALSSTTTERDTLRTQIATREEAFQAVTQAVNTALQHRRHPEHTGTIRNEREGEDAPPEEEDVAERPSPRVVVLHDSLVHKINNTIMKNENVTFDKVWAPTLDEAIAKVDDIDEEPDCIVVQGLTRHIPEMSPQELTDKVVQTVEKSLTKSGKVILSLVVDREDEPLNRTKAETTNGLLTLKYQDDPNVIICAHNNLRPHKYKQSRDYLHLTEQGTSILASNLKKSIAKTLQIPIVRKQTERHERHERGHYRPKPRYRGHNEGEGYGYGYAGAGAMPLYDENYWGR